MKDIERRRIETFLRVQAFGRENGAQFPQASFAGEQFAVIDSVLKDLEKHTSAQVGGMSAARLGSVSKAAAHDELLRTLEAISRTARPLAANTPGLIEKFRVPHGQGNQALLATARAFVAAALPLKAEFIKRGLDENFIEDLEADIDALAEAITRKIESHESHVAATAAIDELIERGMNALRELDPFMRNTFADDHARLAAWLSASRVERSARRKNGQPEKPPAHDSPTETAAPHSGDS
jgi:hypothetical protein